MSSSKLKGKIVVIVAPSGAGKSTLIKKIKAEFFELVESISYTTRPKRPGDENGVQYFFIDVETFKKMIADNELLEWAQVHANYYGTSKKFVEGKLAQGASLIFDIDVQGADSFKKYFGPLAQTIFIAPPSLEALEKRLRMRNTDSEEVIALRVKNAAKELLRKNDFDYCVVNDDLERAFIELKNIITKIIR
ncbi:MAG: guanylate kinase [Bdellovibrionales bacterium RIFOXYD12_FULL_39_22]|nr:MAG: guanylate kinase [Bdellovibrionales bacterium RIFOXYB1_FULL_39_21]OFZ41748.1 MAG: guanylate kinase [Bdellovibrionales bacterium RIFOXYC12_FULL_39_17]OFZ46148.1 MAG: guanylate kinase [Bdellovibrionales bacterium RIFOXYC1_FULL_39_130]OFZ74974.1 MAG: guanylate kinase [Bdellovibrionales bacterium RIFOXYD1_FULL_39_84]OFZ76121.1 MAG: guanylate kinase [Bdellovibrionales bacterium RIFOXYC2_FULL_39_8]OFZ92827.1 MAG: guanylate kinase [Bdellovibrionales bacterium RIFOXYD12_FULL_39_22]HLE12622.1 